MKFIGRRRELESLEAAYQIDGGFVAIYGRWRVGKTTLIKEFIKDKLAFYFPTTEEVESQSMKRFASVAARTTKNPMLQRVAFSDWLGLFRVIPEYCPEEKKVLVIDEFPYLVKSNPAFPSILQNAWNEILEDGNVMLVLCGSSIGMMQKYALSYDSPLYGRRTVQIRLAPLPFPDMYAAWSLSFEDAVKQYSTTDGVPKYLKFFNERDDLLQQVESVILSKNGSLYEEPNFLPKDEVASAMNYLSIIRVIAEGGRRLDKIAGVMGVETSGLAPYLSTLSDLGSIAKDTPVVEKNPEKSRKGLYFVQDNFVRFWFRYVYPHRGELELDNPRLVMDEIEKDLEQKFVVFAYEDVCRAVFADLCRNREIPFTPSRIGAYWLDDLDSDTEIDVIMVDHQNHQVFIGECKFHIKPVDAPVLFILRDKMQVSVEIQSAFKGHQLLCGVFSKSGFTPRLLDMTGQNPSLFLINEDKLTRTNT